MAFDDFETMDGYTLNILGQRKYFSLEKIFVFYVVRDFFVEKILGKNKLLSYFTPDQI